MKVLSLQNCFCIYLQLWFVKKQFNNIPNNVNLHSIDVTYEQLKALNNNQDFNPADLKDIFYNFMKEAAGISNHNFIRNSNAYMSSCRKIDSEIELSWVDDTYQKKQQRFQLGY